MCHRPGEPVLCSLHPPEMGYTCPLGLNPGVCAAWTSPWGWGACRWASLWGWGACHWASLLQELVLHCSALGAEVDKEDARSRARPQLL